MGRSTVAMSETKQATGVSQGVTEKASGWVEFAIDVGSQYPVKVSTKIPEIVELGRAATLAGQLATWTYEESDGNANPHKPGTFYKNRTLSRVEVGGTQNPAQSVATPGDGAQARPPVLGGDKDRLIVRQVCIKAAAELHATEDSTDPDALALQVMKSAQRFETWIYRDIDVVPF
jgi:hypothetical protein